MIKHRLLVTVLTLTLAAPLAGAQQDGKPNKPAAMEHQQHHPGAGGMAQDMGPGEQTMGQMRQRWSDMEKRLEQMAATEDSAKRREMMQQMRAEMKRLMLDQDSNQDMGPDMMMGRQGMSSGMMPMMGRQGMMGRRMRHMMAQHQAVMARLQAIEQRLNLLEAQTW